MDWNANPNTNSAIYRPLLEVLILLSITNRESKCYILSLYFETTKCLVNLCNCMRVRVAGVLKYLIDGHVHIQGKVSWMCVSRTRMCVRTALCKFVHLDWHQQFIKLSAGVRGVSVACFCSCIFSVASSRSQPAPLLRETRHFSQMGMFLPHEGQ